MLLHGPQARVHVVHCRVEPRTRLSCENKERRDQGDCDLLCPLTSKSPLSISPSTLLCSLPLSLSLSLFFPPPAVYSRMPPVQAV